MDTAEEAIRFFRNKGLNENLEKHLQVEYPDLLKVINVFRMGISSIPPGLKDFYDENFDILKRKINALIKNFKSGRSFRYVVCDICRPEKLAILKT